MKVLVVDDHAILRSGLRALLESRSGFEIHESASGREGVAHAKLVRPDIVVMDVSMPDLNGIDATRQIQSELPTTRIIGLSMHTDVRYVTAMLAAGASGYLLKDAAYDELLLAIDAVMANRRYVSAALQRGLVEAELTPASDRGRELTAREREVVKLIAEGKTSKEIGAQLGIAVPTVETHRRQIMDKLLIRTIAELTKFAIREGLTTADK